jgi:hypothetical protein
VHQKDNAEHAARPEDAHLSPEKPPVQTSLNWTSSADRAWHLASGFLWSVEGDSRSRVLLPLRGSARGGSLRENVRAASVCIALVGEVLRETPFASAG